LNDYLYQRCGGNPFYSDRMGVPELAYKHSHINLTQSTVERWLHIMEECLDECHEEFKVHHRQMLLDHMRYLAYYLLVCSEKYKHHAAKGAAF
jgi:truncated hemoglobin YjbI